HGNYRSKYYSPFFCPIGAFCNKLDTIGRERPRRVFKYRGTAYATPHSKPWSAVLLREKEYDGKRTACGAFLINRPPNEHDYVENGSSDLLLTAAHCLMDMK
uniref:Peptidase S1 domain-containing protein n=1 Tax=Romanomermis culicivorax TaxID=13658 RepID=A0A915K5N4_ROMCU